MTAPTMTTDDFMFDLDLRIVPVEERRDVLPRAMDTRGEDGCIGVPGSLGGCTYTCYTYTCRRCNV
jgi:hypothetical protein